VSICKVGTSKKESFYIGSWVVAPQKKVVMTRHTLASLFDDRPNVSSGINFTF